MSSIDVMIVEPFQDLAEVLSTACRKKGFSTCKAQTAQEAVHMADRYSPKIIILELIIPSHNGLEFIHEYRSYPEWLDTPIIIYSHIAPSELGMDEKMLKEMGITAHFYKPTATLSELIKTVETTFESINI